jgi:copper chaperone CopZ
MNETLTYRVPGVSCDHCRAAIEQEVAPLAGVASVVVDLDAKTVIVGGTALDGDAIVAAIGDAGYDVAGAA